METFLLALHIILSVVIVIVILMQSGQGGGLGAGFSNAAAMGQEVFGGRGAAGFLEKATVALGTAFMVTSMALAWYSSKPQSALDLETEVDQPAHTQAHDIIEEGSSDVELDDVPEGDEFDQPAGGDAEGFDIGDFGDEESQIEFDVGDSDGEGMDESEVEELEQELNLGGDTDIELELDDEPAGEIEVPEDE